MYDTFRFVALCRSRLWQESRASFLLMSPCKGRCLCFVCIPVGERNCRKHGNVRDERLMPPSVFVIPCFNIAAEQVDLILSHMCLIIIHTVCVDQQTRARAKESVDDHRQSNVSCHDHVLVRTYEIVSFALPFSRIVTLFACVCSRIFC